MHLLYKLAVKIDLILDEDCKISGPAALRLNALRPQSVDYRWILYRLGNSLAQPVDDRNISPSRCQQTEPANRFVLRQSHLAHRRHVRKRRRSRLTADGESPHGSGFDVWQHSGDGAAIELGLTGH